MRSETLAAEHGERLRIRYRRDGASAAAIFERAPRGRTLEARLLPFLARKTDRVPAVYSRGLPPAHALHGPWLLLEDVLSGAATCGDPVGILRTKLDIEDAVAGDLRALRALGLAERPLPAALSSEPLGLVHGALTCEAARRIDRGIVIVGWSHAFLGPALIDAVMLAKDVERRGDPDGANAVRDMWLATHAADRELWRLAGV